MHAAGHRLRPHLPGLLGLTDGSRAASGNHGSERVERVFERRVEALAEVRALVEQTLHDWSLGALVPDAELVAVELATNAIRHAHSSFTIRLLRSRAGGVRLEVQDRSDRPPVCLPPDRHRIGGRGIQIVDSLTRSWGSHPDGGGKVVWAELDAPRLRRLAS